MIRRNAPSAGLKLSLFIVVILCGAAATDATVSSSSSGKDDGSCSVLEDAAQSCQPTSSQQEQQRDEHYQQEEEGKCDLDEMRANDSHHHPKEGTTEDHHHYQQQQAPQLVLQQQKQDGGIDHLYISDDLMQRIYTALVANGLESSDDEVIKLQIAANEVLLYEQEKEDERSRQEEEQSRQARALLLQQRRQLQQDDHNNNDDEPNNIKPEFPYILESPPPPLVLDDDDDDGLPYYYYSLDFVKDWEPPGGGRYSEYATGHSPYVITDDLKRQADEIARERRPYIQQAMQYAWDGYRQYAFGYDEVRPQSKRGTNHWGGIAVSLVDSLDTLWIMNMHAEFEQARDYVRDELSHNQDRKVSVFETTIRSLGGLLSAYDFSRDDVFLDEAMDLARRLMRAFVHPVAGETILPFGEVNLQNGSCNMIPWAGGNAILSEFGTLQLEFRYLDQIVQSSETRGFRDKVESIFEVLHEMSPNNGLFPYYMNTKHHKHSSSSSKATKTSPLMLAKPYFSNDHITFGAMADSFYEYMLKIWIQGGKVEPMYRDMYDKAMQGMHDELLHISSPSGLTYLADQVGPGYSHKNKNLGKGRKVKHKMDHLVCFVGGMLALGAYTDPRGLKSARAQRDLQTAKALTYTCYQMYARMKTGISPEFVEFVAGDDFRVGSIAPHYLLRPEAVESFYILTVLTGDPIYREWGWEVFQSIEKYCKTHVAYGSLGNVQDQHSPPRDDMESFFLAETLKYLYLLNDPDSEIDILNKHVFNTEAHPMRIFPVIEEELQNQQSEDG